MNKVRENSVVEDLAQTMRALGDANRLGIVLAVGAKELSVTEIINATGLSQTLVSFHLRALREARVVTTKRNGPFIYYSLSDTALLDVLSSLAAIVSDGGAAALPAAGRGGAEEQRARARR